MTTAIGDATGTLADQCRDWAVRARSASRALASVRGDLKDAWLGRAARAVRERAREILEANAS